MAATSVSPRRRWQINLKFFWGPLVRSTFSFLFAAIFFFNCSANETDSKVIKFYGTSQLANYAGQLAPQ